MNVDDAAGHGLAERRGQDLHVAGEDDELNVVFLDELEDLGFLGGLGVLGDGKVVEFDAVGLGEGGVFGVVGDDDGDLEKSIDKVHNMLIKSAHTSMRNCPVFILNSKSFKQ